MSAIISRENYDPSRIMNKIQVLIINQNKEVTALLKNILAAIGLTQSYAAGDAVEAIRYLKEVKINIVITDSELQVTHPAYATKDHANYKLSGAEFVKSLRQSSTSPNPYVAVVILAREMHQDEIIRIRDAGVNGVVLRPLEALQLCQSIRDIIESPRKFIVSGTYKGPCRRQRQLPLAMPDRRKMDIYIVKSKR